MISISFNPLLVQLRFFSLSILVGSLVGVATLLLIDMIKLVRALFFDYVDEPLFIQVLLQSPAWLVVSAPVAGGLFVGLLIYFSKGRRYHGIADVMEACAVNGARMDVRSGVGAAIAAAVSMGTGAPVGREGPAVHIGASISAWIAGKLGLTQSESLTLLGCGAAAAVTASFNAPVAGVLFALEVVVGYYTMRVFAPVVVASATSVAIRYAIIGNASVFPQPELHLRSLLELPFFGLLGVLCAVSVLLFIYLTGFFQSVWNVGKVPLWCRPALGGLVLGLIALYQPHILGSGYAAVELALAGNALPGLLLTLLVVRLFGTSLALGSGFAGGVFTPALVIGVLLGGAVWSVLAVISPISLSEQPVYSVVGMGALASAMLGAPISTVLIVFELTANYEITIAVMLAAAMASTLMQLAPHTSYFRWQLSRRGINITSGRDQSLLRTRTVADLVRDDFTRISAGETLIDTQRNLSAQKHRVAIQTDTAGILIGSASLRLLVAASVEHGFDTATVEVLQPGEVSIVEHTNLVSALQFMAEHKLDYLPVVRSAEAGRELKGIVNRTDLMQAYYTVLKNARAEEFGVN